MIESHEKSSQAEKRKPYSLFLAAGVVVLLAYTVTYLLTVSPLVVRAISTLLGNG